ncbi:MAG: vWA domain-containing protein [Acidobacteriota bacterium]
MGKKRKNTGKAIRGCLGCGCLTFFLFLLLIVFFAEQVPEENWEATEPVTFDDPVEIPLDDNLDGAEASLARNFYFIVDGSGSMKSKPSGACRGDQRSPSKLAGAQWAVEQFLERVPDDVNLGLYLFDRDGRREVVPLAANNREAFLRYINNIRAGGGTPLGPAIHFATDQLVEQYKRQLGYGEFRLVVVTDGRADQIPEAARYAAHFGMPIYAIGLCISDDHPLRRYAVSYRAADSFEDLAQGLEETLAELPEFDVTDFEATDLETQ